MRIYIALVEIILMRSREFTIYERTEWSSCSSCISFRFKDGRRVGKDWDIDVFGRVSVDSR